MLITFPLLVHVLAYEGLDGLVLSQILKSDTKYSPGYSEERFRLIQVGSSKEKVVALMGPPLEKKVYGNYSDKLREEYWWYSESPTSTHFHHRFLVFSSRGLVKEIGHEFYVD